MDEESLKTIQRAAEMDQSQYVVENAEEILEILKLCKKMFDKLPKLSDLNTDDRNREQSTF